MIEAKRESAHPAEALDVGAAAPRGAERSPSAEPRVVAPVQGDPPRALHLGRAAPGHGHLPRALHAVRAAPVEARRADALGGRVDAERKPTAPTMLGEGGSYRPCYAYKERPHQIIKT